MNHPSVQLESAVPPWRELRSFAGSISRRSWSPADRVQVRRPTAVLPVPRLPLQVPQALQIRERALHGGAGESEIGGDADKI